VPSEPSGGKPHAIQVDQQALKGLCHGGSAEKAKRVPAGDCLSMNTHATGSTGLGFEPIAPSARIAYLQVLESGLQTLLYHGEGMWRPSGIEW
jgi:hypothetical protein